MCTCTKSGLISLRILITSLFDRSEYIPEMKAAWNELSTGMKRNMCYWVGSAKTTATRAKRIAELLRRVDAGEFQVGKGRRNG